MDKPSLNTEQQILEAARKVFLSKGLDGARMQDIADEAGINKALLHYYYRSKEKLFELIFEQETKNFHQAIFEILVTEESFFEKIRKIVSHDIDKMMLFPSMPLFILSETSRNPDKYLERFPEKTGPILKGMEVLRKDLQREQANGTIRADATVEDLMINLVSMCVFPFLAMPMFSIVMKEHIPNMDITAFMEARKKNIADTLIAYLTYKEESTKI